MLGRIPANRLYQTGLNILNMFPLPTNNTAANSNFNYQITRPAESLISYQPAIRLDYQPKSSLRTSFKWGGWLQKKQPINGSIPGWNDTIMQHPLVSTMAITVNYSLTPTMFLEGTYGHSQNEQADRPGANLNTAVFAPDGRLWFTGQSGVYGSLDPATGKMTVYSAPRGRGPYGITASSDGTVWYASLAGNHLGRIDPGTGEATVIEPPTAGQGARRAWADSHDRVWISEWNVGQVGMYDPSSGEWREWKLPGSQPQTYSVYVDDRDVVWLTDFGGNAIVAFDPVSEAFTVLELETPGASVRQMLGRPGEAWGAESAADKLVVARTVWS